MVFKWRGQCEQRGGSRNVEVREGTASREDRRSGESVFVGWGVAGMPGEESRRAGSVDPEPSAITYLPRQL